MTFKHRKKNNVTIIYGFERDDKFYDMVLTLHKEKEITSIYGLLSRVPLTKENYKDLYAYIQCVSDTPHIQFEAVPELIALYRRSFVRMPYKILEEKKSSLFNGHKCSVFKVRIRKE